MAAKFTDTTINPQVLIPSGTSTAPFTTVFVDEVSGLGVTARDFPSEIVRVTLSEVTSSLPGGLSDLGSLSDPLDGGTYDKVSHTFTETTPSTTGSPLTQALINRLVYTAPVEADGGFLTVNATVSLQADFAPTQPIVVDPSKPVLQTVTPPAITSTIANEPVASGGNIRPFASVRITDTTGNYSAQDVGAIVLTDAAGNATDADGLLTGTGLSKTGVGTYTLTAASSYAFQANLQALVFTPSAVAAGSTRITGFNLAVSDVATTLSATDKTTSVLVVGPTPTPTPPLIAGTVAGQTVAPGNAISPFNGVTISDGNANPQDSATITVSGGGTLSGTGLTDAGGGVYTLAATTPAALTALLGKLSFSAPPLATGQSSLTSSFKLAVADGTQIATDSTTTVIEAAPPPPPPTSGNFIVGDQSTGQQAYLSGDKYAGPAAGINQQLVLITPDNLNITATTPNVFIHSGSGTDALNVSSVNGNNILDGSTGSNFLVGGTGLDTFFLDDRNAASDVYSTVVNFHSGDNVTIFGVDPVNFHVVAQNNLGAAGYTGLTYTFSAAGKPNASIVIAGFSTADLANGRLTASYGTNTDLPGQPGSGGLYLNVHGN